MIEQYDHTLVSSFILWFDHYLLDKGQAFTNTSVELFKSNDSSLKDYSVYASPYKQWVSDYSISGVTIPSGIYDNGGGFIPRGQSGLLIDFNNGRAIFTGSSNINLPHCSGSFAIKDFNIYYTNIEEQKLLFNTKFVLRPTTYQQLTGLKEDEKTYPSVFVKYLPGRNVPYAFGGMDETKVEFRAIVLADSSYGLDGLCSIFRDKSKTYVPTLSSSDLPYGYLGDYKSGLFNYLDIIPNKPLTMFITDVYVSKMYDKLTNTVNNLFGAFVDFDVTILRHPRV